MPECADFVIMGEGEKSLLLANVIFSHNNSYNENRNDYDENRNNYDGNIRNINNKEEN